MKNVEIYILTHKKFDEDYDKTLYSPILNGAINHNDDYGFLRDDTGENISNLNYKFSELTGQYWAWKNSNADIYGFCHYRRWFVKNFKFEKITKEDILNALENHDIILPKEVNLGKTGYELIRYVNDNFPDYDVKLEEYKKIEIVLKEHFPEYYSSYIDVMNSKYLFAYNMFICDRNLANDYFKWLFKVFELLEPMIDYSLYGENPRIFGFLSERLLTTFVKKNNLKIKEYDIYFSDRKFPILQVLYTRFPNLAIFESTIIKILNKL